MYSATARYALRILGFLAERPGQWVQGREIAGATGIPANYLSKILNQLRKKRVVASQKGWGGGFRLEPAATRMPIRDVLEVFDGQLDTRACVFELRDCDADNPCPLHDHWERVRTEYDQMLDAVTVGGLRARPAR
ncbi:MAG: Rrf2 family transcriptional regulator [Acidobacteriota bacterium]